VDANRIKHRFLAIDEIRAMKKEQVAVLVNIERFRIALQGENNQTEWDLEKIDLRA